MGYLFSSFLWTYVLCLLPVGIIIDRFGSKSINSFGVALWSVAIAFTAGAWSFGSLAIAAWRVFRPAAAA